MVRLEDLADPAQQQLLRRCFADPESFKPARTNRLITEEAADAFAATAEHLRAAGVEASATSHFLTQCLFCFFAEDVGLLPGRLFERLVGNRSADAAALQGGLQALFATMRDGGLFGADSISWFNGGLFEHVEVPALTAMDVAALRNAAALDWSAIDPSIFGTLFERGLDPKKRSQLGAHYTDPATIMRLVEPVVERPLRAEWERVKALIAPLAARSRRVGDADWRKAEAAFVAFLEKLREFRVLDPACGSGNFLYLALRSLKDIEHQANIEAEGLGLQRQVDAYTSPANVLGIEINPHAAELARVTVWIGELQWRLQHGYPFKQNPILDPLDQIECRDALMNADGSEAEWPRVSVVVGNPPFVGGAKMRGELSDSYVETLRTTFQGRVPGGADFVCYWVAKALTAIETDGLGAAGFVATNSIRGGANRTVLDAVVCQSTIFSAWSDETWINNGADVRVSLVAFGSNILPEALLNGRNVSKINADLSFGGIGGIDLTTSIRLASNVATCFEGIKKYGDFDVPGQVAREWLMAGGNPNGKSNADVLKPWINATDVVRRPSDTWIIDFSGLDQIEACAYESPFEYVRRHVQPKRVVDRNVRTRERWWLFERQRDELRRLLVNLPRFIVTPVVARHRTFSWRMSPTLAMNLLDVVPRSDDVTFGILHSRVHELWSLGVCTWMGVGNDPRYTPTTCFERFAFPGGLTPADTAHQRTELLPDGAVIPADLPPAVRSHAKAIARAAKHLNDLRERWLNPPEWTRREPEVVPLGMERSPYPDRILPRDGFAVQLAQRTLTKLYNERPAWLAQAHAALDAAVAAAYGWTDDAAGMANEDILRRLLALNRERAGRGG